MAWWWGGSATSFPAPTLATNVWLLGLGPATTVPLLLFALAARQLSLTTLGLLQYLEPDDPVPARHLALPRAVQRRRGWSASR